MCHLFPYVVCVCLTVTPAEVEAESEAAAAASILEDTEEIVDCPAEEEAESEAAAVATTETLNKDTDEVVEYIINKLCHDSTKLKLQIEVRDSPSRLPKEMSGLLSSP